MMYGKFRFSILMLFFVALFAQAGLAQGSFTQNIYKAPHYPGEILNFTALPDSDGTLYSKAFSLGKYDGFNFSTFPFKARYQATSVLGAPKITVTVEANFVSDSTDVNWAVIDTVISNLTVETVADIDIDFNDKKYPWYRFKLVGVALGRDDQIFTYKQYLYQNDRN